MAGFRVSSRVRNESKPFKERKRMLESCRRDPLRAPGVKL